MLYCQLDIMTIIFKYSITNLTPRKYSYPNIGLLFSLNNNIIHCSEQFLSGTLTRLMNIHLLNRRSNKKFASFHLDLYRGKYNIFQSNDDEL